MIDLETKHFLCLFQMIMLSHYLIVNPHKNCKYMYLMMIILFHMMKQWKDHINRVQRTQVVTLTDDVTHLCSLLLTSSCYLLKSKKQWSRKYCQRVFGMNIYISTFHMHTEPRGRSLLIPYLATPKSSLC